MVRSVGCVGELSEASTSLADVDRLDVGPLATDWLFVINWLLGCCVENVIVLVEMFKMTVLSPPSVDDVLVSLVDKLGAVERVVVERVAVVDVDKVVEVFGFVVVAV